MTRGTKRTIAIMFTVLATLAALAAAICFSDGSRQSTKQLKISGVAIDAKDGTPIENAKIIVRMNRAGLLTAQRAYFGTTTNPKGHFQVVAKVPFKLHSIEIEAMSPMGKYAAAEVGEKPVTLKLGEVPKNLRGVDYLNYERFCGHNRWRSVDKIIFTGDGWEVRTPKQIEQGFLDPAIPAEAAKK
jgi:hypothetical protein